MKVSLKTADFYLILWCIYNLQGFLFPVGSLFAKVVLLVLMIVSLYYVGYSFSRYSLPKLLKVLAVLIAILSIYGVLFMLFGTTITVNSENIQSFDYLRNVIVSLTPVYAFYVFTQKGQIDESWLSKWAIIFLLVCIAGFYNYNAIVLDNQDTIGESTNNAGYMILSLIVFVPIFHKRQLVQYLYLAIVAFFFIISIKRGAIIIGVLSIAVFLLLPASYDSEKGKKKTKIRYLIFKWLLTAVFIYVGIRYVSNLLSTNDYMNMRYQSSLEGDMSGRENIYKALITYLNERASFFDLLFGGGVYKTIQVSGAAAHNDWLEFLVDNGVIVTLFYLYYWVVMAKTALSSPRNRVYTQIIILFFVNYFLRTFFSMSYSDVTVYASCALGFALATQQVNGKRKIKLS